MGMRVARIALLADRFSLLSRYVKAALRRGSCLEGAGVGMFDSRSAI